MRTRNEVIRKSGRRKPRPGGRRSPKSHQRLAKTCCGGETIVHDDAAGVADTWQNWRRFDSGKKPPGWKNENVTTRKSRLVNTRRGCHWSLRRPEIVAETCSATERIGAIRRGGGDRFVTQVPRTRICDTKSRRMRRCGKAEQGKHAGSPLGHGNRHQRQPGLVNPAN